MMWQSSLPAVDTMAEWPPLVTDRKWCGCEAALMATAAILMLRSVPFLKPTGQDRPDASSRCTCDSVVRAPIAPQEIRSAMYCGLIVQEFGAGRQAHFIDVAQQFARHAQAVVDAEAVVHVRIVDHA